MSNGERAVWYAKKSHLAVEDRCETRKFAGMIHQTKKSEVKVKSQEDTKSQLLLSPHCLRDHNENCYNCQRPKWLWMEMRSDGNAIWLVSLWFSKQSWRNSQIRKGKFPAVADVLETARGTQGIGSLDPIYFPAELPWRTAVVSGCILVDMNFDCTKVVSIPVALKSKGLCNNSVIHRDDRDLWVLQKNMWRPVVAPPFQFTR